MRSMTLFDWLFKDPAALHRQTTAPLVANVDVDQLDILQSSVDSAIRPRSPEDSETVAGKETGDGSADSR